MNHTLAPRLPLRRLSIVGAVAILAPAALAHAGDPDRGPPPAPANTCPAGSTSCRTAPAQFSTNGCPDLTGFVLDSGWLPDDDAEIAFRIRGQFGGLVDEQGNAAAVTLGANTTARWPEPITVDVVSADGADGRNTLRVEYGFEFTAQLKIDLDVDGGLVSGTRDIPIPYLGRLNQFHLRGQAPVTALGFGAEGVVARGTTARTTIVNIDVLDAVLDPFTIWGVRYVVHGGFRFDAEGYGSATYRTSQIAVRESSTPITSHPGSVTIQPSAGTGFGAHQQIHVTPTGEIECEVGVTLKPTIYLSLFGVEFRWDYPINLAVQRSSSDAVFAEQTLDLPLPDIALDRETLDFGTLAAGAPGNGTLVISNNGDDLLTGQINTRSTAISLSAVQFTVPAQSSTSLSVTADASRLAPGESIEIRSNDPDRPSIIIAITGSSAPGGSGQPGPYDGTGGYTGGGYGPDGGGGIDAPYGVTGGCQVARPREFAHGWLLAVFGVLALAPLRRRRGEAAQVRDSTIGRQSAND